VCELPKEGMVLCLKWIKSVNCLVRRETVPFYRSKSSIYNVWFIGASTLYFQTNLTLQGSQAACIIRLHCPKEHSDVLAVRCLPHGRATAETVWIPVRTLMCVLDLYLGAGNCRSDGLHMYGLTGLHAINRVIACSLICNRNLVAANVQD
jgi:hypothetical protein